MRRQMFNLRKGRDEEIRGHRRLGLLRTGTVRGIWDRPSAFNGASNGNDDDGEEKWEKLMCGK